MRSAISTPGETPWSVICSMPCIYKNEALNVYTVNDLTDAPWVLINLGAFRGGEGH